MTPPVSVVVVMVALASATILAAEDELWPPKPPPIPDCLQQLAVLDMPLDRKVLIHVPSSVRAKAPLVVDFHALSSNPTEECFLSDMPAKADREGFIVALPRGYDRGPPAGPGFSWNAGACCPYAASTEVDDIGFARLVPGAVAAFVARSYNISVDSQRVYATGMSNGGPNTQPRLE